MYVYFGSDDFSLNVLKGLVKEEPPGLIVTQPDRRAGRQKKIKPGPLASFAKESGFDLYQPENLKTETSREPILNKNADLLIVVSFGQILPGGFLKESPPVINGHASLLPKYRGASPIQSVLLNGENTTGMTIMRMVKALDAGPILNVCEIPIVAEDDHGRLSLKLMDACVDLLLPYLKMNTIPKGREQDHEAATYCGKLTKEDSFLQPERESAKTTLQKIKAFSPKPGACLFLNDNGRKVRFKILDALPAERKVLAKEMLREKNQLWLGCHDGSLEIFRVQPEGKAPMACEAFLNGWKGELLVV